MNTDSETTTSPYLGYYGMVREPFGQAIEDDLFYAEPNRKQKLDILLHLTQYGNELMVVTGPTGSGKTTLLQQFQSKAQNAWRLVRIEAKGGIDERRLVQQLYHQLGMEYRGASHSDLLENLERHLASLQHSGLQPIMLIDDAEHLPVTALKQILQMAELCNPENKPLLRVILFGTDKLTENFADPQLGHYADDIVRRTLELPPFDREQTTQYILHRLSAAQFAANEPFTESALHKLHRQSAGLPGRINNLAHKLLVDTLPSKAAASASEGTGLIKPLRIVAVFAVGAIIAALLIFQDEVNELVNPGPATVREKAIADENSVEESIPDKDMADKATAGKAIPSEVAEQAATEQASAAIEQPLAAAPEADNLAEATAADLTQSTQEDALPGTSADEPLAQAETTQAPEDIEPKPVTAAADSAAKHDASTPPAERVAATDMPAKATTPAVETTAERSEKPRASAKTSSQRTTSTPADTQLPTRDNNWLLAQDGRQYTLQLVAGKKLATIQQYLAETVGDDPALQQQLALYHSQRKGQPWHGLILGVYADKQAAIDARSRLPKRLLRTTPWVRTIGSIQRDLPTP
jgi:DamX protein